LKRDEIRIIQENKMRQNCLDIVFNFGDKLFVSEGRVIIKTEDSQIEIARPHNEKTFWLDTYNKIRKFYNYELFGFSSKKHNKK